MASMTTPAHSTSRIVFCEKTWQVDAVHQNTEPNLSSCTVIALTPEAAWRCQQRGRPYLKIEDHYEPSSLIAVWDKAFKEILAWVEHIDQYWQGRDPAHSSFKPAKASFFLLQNFINEFFIAAPTLTSLVKQTQAQTIYYWPQEISPSPAFLIPEGPLYPSLIPSMAKELAIQLHPLPNTGPRENRTERTLGITATLRDIVSKTRLFPELVQCRRLGLLPYVRIRFNQPDFKRPAVLVLGYGDDLDPVIIELRQEKRPLVWIKNLNLSSSLQKEKESRFSSLWVDLKSQSWFWEPLNKAGVETNGLFEQIIQTWWLRIVPQMWRAYQAGTQLIGIQSISSVLAWEAGANALSAGYLQAAEQQKIPRTIYQHGGSVFVNSKSWYTYLLHSEQLLTYGTGTTRRLADTWPPGVPQKTSLVSVGSARLDAIRRRMTPQKNMTLRQKLQKTNKCPLILYVPTSFGGFSRAFGEMEGYPDVSYFELQQQALSVFRDFPSVQLIYKAMPALNSLQNPILSFLPKALPKAQILTEPALSQLIWAVDAIIVDHAITALGETLLTNKRVIVYLPPSPTSGGEILEPKTLLSKRAQIAETPEAFVTLIRQFLEMGDFSEIPNPNQEFLAAYGTHLNDGRSAQRVASALGDKSRVG